MKSRHCRPPAFASSGLSRGFFVALPLLLLLLGGCEDQHLAPLDPDGSPPFIRAFRIAPDSISLNTLTPSGGRYGINLLCLAQVTDPDGPSTLGPVIADVIAPGGGDPLVSVALATDSTGGNVRYFSGQIRFSVTKTDIGGYRVLLRATDELALSGNTVDRRLIIWRTNAPPVLSNLVAPDTVVLTPGDTVHIPMSITVSDSNGVADVREVFFRSLDSSDPTKKFLLQDNGDLKNYGDQTAGDGIYSIIVMLTDSPTVRKTYRFAFQAIDSFADSSATLLHSLTVR